MHQIGQIQLFHTSIPGGPCGISFQIGSTTLFTSPEDECLYVIDDPSQLVVSGPLPPGMATFVKDTIIEPRLAAFASR